MELSKQVTSLELSKKLKELGVKQESLFIWSVPKPENARTNIDEVKLRDMQPEIYMRGNSWGECFGEVAAYTIAELGEMLLVSSHSALSEAYKFLHNRLEVDKFDLVEHMSKPDFGAKMLIYLLEKGLLKAEDIK